MPYCHVIIADLGEMQDSALWFQFEGLLLKQVTWTTGKSANENDHVCATHFED